MDVSVKDVLSLKFVMLRAAGRDTVKGAHVERQYYNTIETSNHNGILIIYIYFIPGE